MCCRVRRGQDPTELDGGDALRGAIPGGGPIATPDLGGGTPNESPRAREAARQFGCLLPALFVEELRMQIAFTSRWAFSMFVALIFLFSMTTGLVWADIVRRIPPGDLHFMVNSSVLMFSFILGMAALSETLSASHRFLVADSVRLPVAPRVARAALLARETLFALVFLFGPLALGIALSLPFSGRSGTGAAVHLTGLLMTFVLGLSLSFATMAALTAPARRVLPWMLLAAPIAAFALALRPDNALLPGYGLSRAWVYEGRLALGLLVPGIYMPIALMVPGILHMGTLTVAAGVQRSEMAEVAARIPRRIHRRELVALEYLQLRRSRGFQKIVGSYLFPLVIMSVMMLYVDLALGPVVETGLLFYVPLVGLISTTIYSWENNVDPPGHFALVPVSMADVIRAKLLLFYALSGVFSTAYVLLMAAYLKAPPTEIVIAVPAALLLSFYTGTVTAYLAGIDPNRRLFDPVIIARFFLMVSLPLMALLISVQRPVESAPFATAVMAILILATVHLWGRMSWKWRLAPFD